MPGLFYSILFHALEEFPLTLHVVSFPCQLYALFAYLIVPLILSPLPNLESHDRCSCGPLAPCPRRPCQRDLMAVNLGPTWLRRILRWTQLEISYDRLISIGPHQRREEALDLRRDTRADGVSGPGKNTGQRLPLSPAPPVENSSRPPCLGTPYLDKAYAGIPSPSFQGRCA